MKIKNLLFLGAMLLIGGTAMAEIVDGVRQFPAPAQTAFNYGDTLYMYNQKQNLFFRGTQPHGTRGGVEETGWKVLITNILKQMELGMEIPVSSGVLLRAATMLLSMRL